MDKTQELKTMSVLALAMLVFFVIFKLKIFLILAVLLLIISLFISKLSLIIAKSWMVFAHFLGKINTKIIIFIAYYLCLVPVAYCYRLFNKKEVSNFFDKKEHSYFKDINKKYEKKDFEKMW